MLDVRPRHALGAVTTACLITLGFFATNHHDAEKTLVSRAVEPLAKAGLVANPSNAAKTLLAASNSTVGFSKILYINMKQRWDKWDAAVLQAYTSGLDIELYEAVDGKKDIEEAGRVGLPPHSEGALSGGQIACWRSHANIWDEMVRTRSPPILLLEADAGWDANFRGIMGLFNKHFLDHLVETQAKPTNAPPLAAEALPNRPKDRPVEYNPDDPWQSEYWDIISVGHCNDQQPWAGQPQKEYLDEFYTDPPIKETMFFVPADKNRVVKRSHGFACTTGYAVSHRGAAKMLLRHIQDLNKPIDLIMSEMVNAGDLISYTINPPPVIQWAYRQGIGMTKGGKNSDISRVDGEDKADEKPDVSGFEQANKDHSIWTNAQDKFPNMTFKKGALDKAYAAIFSDEAQFTMPKIPGV